MPAASAAPPSGLLQVSRRTGASCGRYSTSSGRYKAPRVAREQALSKHKPRGPRPGSRSRQQVSLPGNELSKAQPHGIARLRSAKQRQKKEGRQHRRRHGAGAGQAPVLLWWAWH